MLVPHSRIPKSSCPSRLQPGAPRKLIEGPERPGFFPPPVWPSRRRNTCHMRRPAPYVTCVSSLPCMQHCVLHPFLLCSAEGRGVGGLKGGGWGDPQSEPIPGKTMRPKVGGDGREVLRVRGWAPDCWGGGWGNGETSRPNIDNFALFARPPCWLVCFNFWVSRPQEVSGGSLLGPLCCVKHR